MCKLFFICVNLVCLVCVLRPYFSSYSTYACYLWVTIITWAKSIWGYEHCSEAVEGVNDRYLSTCMQVVQLCSEIHKLINSIWNEEELPRQQKKFFTLLV